MSSIAGPPEWKNDYTTWKGVIPAVVSLNTWVTTHRIWIDLVQYGGGTLVLKDVNTAEKDTVQFWKDYSTAIAENMRKAVLAKGQLVSNGKCTGKYALSCVDSLWKAAVPFIQALNKINNHDTITHCCKHQSNTGDDTGDTSGIDLMTYVKVLQLASDLANVDPVDDIDTHGPTNQDPEVQPADD
jgi:hypothetical protein